MVIDRITIDGYRNVMDTSIEFSDVTALVGVNNYGKSNVLDCISFSQRFIKNSPQIKTEMMQDKERVPINIKTAKRNFLFEIEYTTDFNGKEVTAVYSFSFEWIKNKKSGRKIVKEELKIKENSKNQRFANYISRDSQSSMYKSSLTARCDTPISIEYNELIVNKLSNYDNLFYLDLIKELNNINFDFNTFLDTSNSMITPPIDFTPDEKYLLEKDNGNNIAKIIYNLQKEYPDKYSLLINSFKSLFSSIDEILPERIKIESKTSVRVPDDAPFKIQNEIYFIMIKEKFNNQTTEFSSLSKGTKRIFMLLTASILAEDNINMIAFEELENSIHPPLFERLLNILTQLNKKARILITSHSPYLIRYLDLNKIYIGVPSEDGVAMFKKLKKSQQNAIYKNAEDMEISVGDYIFDMLLDSYDDRENNILCSFLENDNNG